VPPGPPSRRRWDYAPGVPLLAFKLLLTPLLIGGASLAARRWGHAIGGLLVSLPLTSGPVALFLALDLGPAFAAAAVTGSLAGLIAIAGFAVGYAAAGPRLGAGAGLVAASAAFVAVGLAVQPLLDASIWVLLGLVVLAVTGTLRALPSGGERRPHGPPPRWDLPARMVVGTAIVVVLTALAPALGPHTSGLVATFPVYVSVLAVFAQRQDGPSAAIDVLRGLLVGLFGTAVFYVIVAMCLVPLGILPAFGLAVAVTLAIGAVALRRVRAATRAEIEPEPA
jgi:hypothetical protein